MEATIHSQSMIKLKSYHKLIVYQKAKDLVMLIYKLTKKFPKVEMYVLVPQMRRAAISTLANIVEGYAKSKKEFSRFIDISIGSITELEIYLEISLDLNYMNKNEFEKVYGLLTEVKKLLYSFKRSLRAREGR